MKYDIELFSIFIYCLDFKQTLLVMFIRILKHIRFPFDIYIYTHYLKYPFLRSTRYVISLRSNLCNIKLLGFTYFF